MTIKQAWLYVMIELNKVGMSTVLLEDFIYLANKAVTQYVDKRYNLYEINQQLTDDLRVLTAPPVVITDLKQRVGSIHPATFVGELPRDYFHLLNCVAEFEAKAGCAPGTKEFKGVKKMTAEIASGSIQNYYHRPSFKNPYFKLVGSPYTALDNTNLRIKGKRESNPSPVNIEITFGKDIRNWLLKAAHVEYLRYPQYLDLTEEEIDSDEDTSQTLEFPDYVCLEIIKELVALIMENFSDPRLNTNIPVNQAIPGGANQPARSR